MDLDGERPIEAATVEDAEKRLAEFDKPGEQRPDFILLDLMLPQDKDDAEKRRVDLDAGYLIWFEIRILKKWQSLIDIPIIVITARGRPEYKDQVCSDPKTRWLSKPADPSKVAESIVELLESAAQPGESGGDVKS